LTNEAMREEQDRGQLALGIPGSLSNRPVNAPNPAAAASAVGADAGANATQARKNASTRQYAYDRSITQVKKSRGRLARLSVAVVLNNAVAPGGAKAWTPEDISKVETLLSNGLGISAERGDKLVVSTLNFPVPVPAAPWYEQRDNLIDIGGWVGWALAALLGYFLLARPVLRLAQQAVQRRTTAPGRLDPLEPAALAAAGGATGELAGPAGAALPAPAGQTAVDRPMSVVPLLENYELPPPGSPVDVLVDHLKVLASKEPERVAEVVKQWVQKKNA
ncbi:MAG TPA: flagellar M-ring protein FliF C-terminal domain-containing protein, partial [Roseateles sp.]|uniref:flagellar M-ring protein FliF C-terminal domain-containing protein n=1 Tax=Roseateles sp. TaxID=1971397 RepID=UPI002EDB271C